ncbi:MAG: type II toxin-antitoxin system VapC family toxin [Xanthobacteraceae bacterium]|jgi:PIN domain nuclease of toxin-antitoxin system
MRLLLDTHILLALIEHRMGVLPTDVQALLRDPDNEHHLSAASLWEIAIKSRLGKLRLRPSLNALPELLESLGIAIVSINEHHALAAVEPEPKTRDPFDRMLLAQCQIEGLRLVTTDRALV